MHLSTDPSFKLKQASGSSWLKAAIVIAGKGIPSVSLLFSTTITSFLTYVSMAGRPKKWRKITSKISWKTGLAALERRFRKQTQDNIMLAPCKYMWLGGRCCYGIDYLVVQYCQILLFTKGSQTFTKYQISQFTNSAFNSKQLGISANLKSRGKKCTLWGKGL